MEALIQSKINILARKILFAEAIAEDIGKAIDDISKLSGDPDVCRRLSFYEGSLYGVRLLFKSMSIGLDRSEQVREPVDELCRSVTMKGEA